MITIYTDGACSNNGSKNAIGGWGFVILDSGAKMCENSGKEIGATNQQMELMAVIAALKSCDFAPLCDVTIYSDSAYLINCKNQNWYKSWEHNGWKNSKKQPVANIQLWKELIPYFDDPRFTFKKVNGHSGNHWNEYVDNLAVQARLS